MEWSLSRVDRPSATTRHLDPETLTMMSRPVAKRAEASAIHHRECLASKCDELLKREQRRWACPRTH